MDDLNRIIEKLYHTEWNTLYCEYLVEDINKKKLQTILKTPAQHNSLIKGIQYFDDLDTYLKVKLTEKWINYYENWFKFEKDRVRWKERKNTLISIWVGLIVSIISWIILSLI